MGASHVRRARLSARSDYEVTKQKGGFRTSWAPMHFHFGVTSRELSVCMRRVGWRHGQTTAHRHSWRPVSRDQPRAGVSRDRLREPRPRALARAARPRQAPAGPHPALSPSHRANVTCQAWPQARHEPRHRPGPRIPRRQRIRPVLRQLARARETLRVSRRALRPMPEHLRPSIATPDANLPWSTPCAVRGAAGADPSNRASDPHGAW